MVLYLYTDTRVMKSCKKKSFQFVTVIPGKDRFCWSSIYPNFCIILFLMSAREPEPKRCLRSKMEHPSVKTCWCRLECVPFFVLLCIYAQVCSNEYPRQSGGEQLGSGMDNVSNSTLLTTTPPTTTVGSGPGPVLSASAIVNIIFSVLAIVFLTVTLCYLMHSFNKGERNNRIRTALQNNRQIEEQIATAKARADQQASLLQTQKKNQSNTSVDSPELASTNTECRTQISNIQLSGGASSEVVVDVGGQ